LKSVELVALMAKIIFQHDDQARRQPRFFVEGGNLWGTTNLGGGSCSQPSWLCAWWQASTRHILVAVLSVLQQFNS